MSIDLYNEAYSVDSARRPSHEVQSCLHPRRHRHERGHAEVDRRIRQERGKEETDSPSKNEEVIRMERARQVVEHRTDPNQAFLAGGTHG
jgi:hypothetical protein